MTDIFHSRWLPIVMLTGSNIFMTFAWYGHLKFRQAPILFAILGSWCIAFFEYLLMVPANRWGYNVYSATEWTIMQEVITLSVFSAFAITVLGEKLRWNHWRHSSVFWRLCCSRLFQSNPSSRQFSRATD
jgi:uncharacterized protein (DUF486 family)